MAIYNKLQQIQKSVRSLTKDSKAFNYDYISGDKLLGIIRPKMDELNLLLIPIINDIRTEVQNYKKWNDNSKCMVDATEILYHIRMTMRWVDTEDGDIVEQHWMASGMNGYDKGFGSALTYGERYYLLKLFHIATNCDDVDYISTERDKAIEMAQDNSANVYTPLPDDIFKKMVANYINCIPSKSGKDYRTAWIEQTHAGSNELSLFDAEVVKQSKELTNQSKHNNGK